MTRTEHLLTILGEECVETAHRISKAIRFTLADIQSDQEPSNAQRIIYEFNDIVATMEVLVEEGLLERSLDRIAIEAKKVKIKEYVLYAQNKETIQTPSDQAAFKMFAALKRLIEDAEDRDELIDPETGKPFDDWQEAIDAMEYAKIEE